MEFIIFKKYKMIFMAKLFYANYSYIAWKQKALALIMCMSLCGLRRVFRIGDGAEYAANWFSYHYKRTHSPGIAALLVVLP